MVFTLRKDPSDFHCGSFIRSLTLSSGVGENNVRATYKDGILKVDDVCTKRNNPQPIYEHRSGVVSVDLGPIGRSKDFELCICR